MSSENPIRTAGVEDLIERLKKAGVIRGKEEADVLVADAKRQSMAILDAARREADEIVAAAKQEAERVRVAGEQALELASRDALLKLRESFELQFENRLRKLVGKSLQNPELLKQMILEIAGKNRPSDGEQVDLLVAAEAGPDPLADYVAGLTVEMLREGVTFGVGEDVEAGVRVRLSEREIEVDLSDEAVAAFLARFLVPRFRKIMDFKS